MEKFFQVSITTLEKAVYKGEISSLIAPGELGYLGILADHAALITNLIPGKISFKDNSGNFTIINSKGKGFLEVLNNNLTLLLDYI